ncbi:MAG: Rho termination factor N-terminal domain-containing protein, partial [Kiritimatiellia bacterium]|nr:Rho termination factor N-terminal domain-containing protein [Kiritimatiellia bacterium]
MEERNKREETLGRRRGSRPRYSKNRSSVSRIYADSDPIPPHNNGNGMETDKASPGDERQNAAVNVAPAAAGASRANGEAVVDAPPATQDGAVRAGASGRTKGNAKAMHLSELQKKKVPELNEMASSLGLADLGALRKHELIFEILRANAGLNGSLFGRGVLEILPDGFGFLRSPYYNYLPCPEDIYVSPSQIRRFALRTGDAVEGEIRSPKDKERFFALLRVDEVNGENPEQANSRVPFENLTPLFPDKRIMLEREHDEISMRVM